MDETLELLKELAEAPGVSGQEEAVRQVMRRHLEPLGAILTDHLGSVIGRKEGLAGGPKIMLAGHLDEVGFLVTRITDEGFLKFQTIGGWWEQVMQAQRVTVYTRQGPVVGVIGSKPPHILDAIERVEILRALRRGDCDVLVGINLLREGLDLPEVSLVAILDADKEGFFSIPTD